MTVSFQNPWQKKGPEQLLRTHSSSFTDIRAWRGLLRDVIIIASEKFRNPKNIERGSAPSHRKCCRNFQSYKFAEPGVSSGFMRSFRYSSCSASGIPMRFIFPG